MRFLSFQLFRILFILSILLPNLCFSIFLLLYPKYTPNALIGLFSQFIPARLSFLLMPHSNQRPSVLSILSLSPDMLLNMFTIFRQLCNACLFFKKIVVSSTNCAICIYFVFSYTLISRPLFLFFRILSAKILTTRMNSSALSGHPCLIPLSILKGLDVHPLFVKHDTALM